MMRQTNGRRSFVTPRNAVDHASLHNVDLVYTPMLWQAKQYPQAFRGKMYVCHDGIRTDTLVPNPKAGLRIKSLKSHLHPQG